MRTLDPIALPTWSQDVGHLEQVMAQPPVWLADKRVAAPGDVMILGVAGRMGPTMARLVNQVAPERRIIGVARFSDPVIKDDLECHGVETIQCDLPDWTAIAALPDLADDNFVVKSLTRWFEGATPKRFWRRAQ
jgi:hypothetical protein